MLILKLLRGISASGKNFFAEQFLAKNKHWKMLNRDSIREMLSAGNKIWSQGQKIEQLVTDAQSFMCESLVQQGFNVLISDTNLSKRTLDFWSNKATELSVKFEVDDQFLTAPPLVCVARDAQRKNSVGADVIMQQFNNYIVPMGIEMRPASDFLPKHFNNDTRKPKAVCFDLDGSLAIFNRFDKTALNFRNPYDAAQCHVDMVNEPLRNVLNLYKQAGYVIILLSGRDSKFRPETEAWLDVNNIFYDSLYMRAVGDSRKDSIIKGEIYENLILPDFYVEVAYDDRKNVVDFLRLKNMTVFQVAEGNF